MNNNSGNIYLPILVIITLFISLGITATTFVINQSKIARQLIDREISFQIAEAGLEYYRWHLNHNTEDFQDGTGAPGPYIHDYEDISGTIAGQFELGIVAPPDGSTVVQISSSGYKTTKPNLRKTITITLGIPSFTNFAVAADDEMRFGEGTEVFGPVHSNEGIRFDGLAHNIVTSHDDKYDDDDHGGGEEWAVHTHVSPTDPLPPNPIPDPPVLPHRPDVFEAGRDVNVKSISFTGISGQLDDMQEAADDNGILLDDSGAEGYYIHFNPDDTVDIYTVDSQATCHKRVCFFWWGCWWTDYTGTSLYSVGSTSSFTYQGSSSIGLDMPDNGLIFVEDHVWVDGTIDGERVTVVAAEEPLASGSANITVNNDLLYTNYDGTDAIGLIAQNNVRAGFYSEDDLEIDAALIAQNGNVGRPFYEKDTGTFNPANCNDYANRDTLTSYGAIATNQRYGFAWVGDDFDCGDHTNESGYCNRNLLYDDNFYFAPPPFFPTTGQYRVVSWWQEE